MNIRHLIETCLQETMSLQIATSIDNVPWICTVCFAYDGDFNLYWFSRHDARHSQEIIRNPHVAGAIAVPYVIGDKSRGLQVVGTASELHDEKSILAGLKALKKRYGITPKRAQELQKELLSQKANYGLYSLHSDSIVLHDKRTFPLDPRHEYEVPKRAEKK